MLALSCNCVIMEQNTLRVFIAFFCFYLPFPYFLICCRDFYASQISQSCQQIENEISECTGDSKSDPTWPCFFLFFFSMYPEWKKKRHFHCSRFYFSFFFFFYKWWSSKRVKDVSLFYKFSSLSDSIACYSESKMVAAERDFCTFQNFFSLCKKYCPFLSFKYCMVVTFSAVLSECHGEVTSANKMVQILTTNQGF